MAKRKNRNRSAKKGHTTDCKTFAQQAREYGEYLRWAHRRVSWPAQTREGFDLDPLRLERRINAAVQLYEDFREILHETAPELECRADEVWLKLCLGAIIGMDSIDFSCSILLGAAIWILDCLAKCGRFEEACKLFPAEPITYDDIPCPEVHDLRHEDRAILGVLWILVHRNDDCTGLSVTGNYALARTMMDDYTAKNLQHQDVPSRKRFVQLLDLLPEAEIQQATASYEKQFVNVMERMITSYSIHYDVRDRLESDLRTVNRSALSMLRDAYDVGQEAKQQLTDMLENRSLPLFSAPDHYSGKLRSCAIFGQGNKLEDQILSIDGKLNELTGRVCVFHTISEADKHKAFTPAVCKIWDDFKIASPYELCFAVLYLVEQGSDLPWIYGINSNLLGFCANALPWCNITDLDVDAELELMEPAEPFDEENYSLYNTYFSDRTGQKIDYATRYNLPQIIYGRTGYLLPRTVYEEEKARRWLERFDLLASPLASIALPTIDLMDIHARRTHIPAPSVEPEDGIPAPQELLKRIQELEAERKALRQEAHDAASEAKQLREQLSALEGTADRDRQELADLRELVFSMTTEETEALSDCTMVFPQHTMRNILVFGGHPSWFREIRQKLPDVRFYRHEAKPDRQMIRNADEIWFQTNALSHKLYDAVTDCAAGYPITIHYFRFASATKCAEQLIQAQRA